MRSINVLLFYLLNLLTRYSSVHNCTQQIASSFKYSLILMRFYADFWRTLKHLNYANTVSRRNGKPFRRFCHCFHCIYTPMH